MSGQGRGKGRGTVGLERSRTGRTVLLELRGQVSPCYLLTNCSANLMWAECGRCTQVRPRMSLVAASFAAGPSCDPLARPPQRPQQLSTRRSLVDVR
jgi:hypothetical protein